MTREASLRPEKAGAVTFNLPAKRIVQAATRAGSASPSARKLTPPVLSMTVQRNMFVLAERGEI